jgi:hypothetical protein
MTSLAKAKAPGTAFVVDIKTGKQTNLRYNDFARSHRHYGIWSNSNRNYTVAGGESDVFGSLKTGNNTGPYFLRQGQLAMPPWLTTIPSRAM